MPRTALITAKVEPTVKAKLDAERAKLNLPMSEYIASILAAHLDAKKK